MCSKKCFCAGAGSLALVAALGAAQVAHAAAITVSDVAGLTNAIAKGCSPITLNPGTYDLTTLEPYAVTNGSQVVWGTNCSADGNGPAHIVFKNTIVFQGANTKHWSQKTPEEETIIKGAGANDTMRLFYGYTGGGRGSRFRHITFEGGRSDGYDGGAIYTMGPHMTHDLSVSNCVFRENSARVGGAICGLSVSDSLFENNSAQKGGAVHMDYSNDGVDGKTRFVPWTNYVADCVFRGNSASNTGGGAIDNASNYGAIYGCGFTNNAATTAGGVGGAILLGSSSALTLRNTVFVENKAEGGTGGAVHADSLGGFSDCTFLRNVAKNGGAAYITGAVGTIDGCTVVSNRCTADYASLYMHEFDKVAKTTFAYNATPGSYAGLCMTDFSKAGTVENCTFVANTNKPTLNVGSQLCGITDVIGCTFRGYGDMIARHYDRCVFDRCAFDYESYGGGMIQFDTTTGAGCYLRNCLFSSNSVHTYVYNASGKEVEIANCTFAGNQVKRVVNQQSQAMSSGYLIYAFRGGSDPNTDNQYPSTNLVNNCVFADNTWQNGSGTWDFDVSAYATTTRVARPADNVFSNCLYQTYQSEGVAFHSYNGIVEPPKFVLDDHRYPDAPPFMPRRGSKARKAGLVLPWMTGATDLAGVPMVSGENTVDVGSYQCTLPPSGAFFMLK